MTIHKTQKNDNEIDLLWLLQSFWKEKVFITAIAVFFTIISGVYFLLVSPSFTIKFQVYSPSRSDIVELAKFDVLKSIQSESNVYRAFTQILKLNQLNEKFLAEEAIMGLPFKNSESQVFEEFLQFLRSDQLLEKFLAEENIMDSFNQQKTTQQKSLVKLINMTEMIVTRLGSKANINFKFKDVGFINQFINQFFQFAIEKYQENLSNKFSFKKDQKIKKLKDMKQALIYNYEERLNMEIAKLEEAYDIAKNLNLVEPQESRVMLENTEAISSPMVQELRYLYQHGTRSISAEIKTLKERISNRPDLIPGMIGIEHKLELLNLISFSAKNVMPIKIIDERKVEPSKHRIEKIVSGKKINIPFDSGNIERSSKPSLVLTISFFTGFIFAIVLLLIRNLLRNREART